MQAAQLPIGVKPTEISSSSPMIIYRCFWNVFRGQGSQPAVQEETEDADRRPGRAARGGRAAPPARAPARTRAAA